MVAVTLCTMCTPIASAAYYDLPYTYTFEDGDKVSYNFDGDGIPYTFEDGERVVATLPLDQFKVTDPEVLAELNSVFEEEIVSSKARAAAPTSYYSFKLSNRNTVSQTYVQAINFANVTSGVNTQYMDPYPSHNYVALKTTNLKTANILSSKKITYTYWYYELGNWYAINCNKNCNSGVLHQYYTTVDFVMFSFTKTSNIKSFTANIWTQFSNSLIIT